jgi:hypothetical protein
MTRGHKPTTAGERDLRSGLLVVVLGLATGFAGVLYVHCTQRANGVPELDTGPGEAFAALAGAIVGVGGTEIGRATGTQRRGGKKVRCEHVGFDAALVLSATVATCGAIGLIFIDDDHAWAAAAVALAVSAVGIPSVHLPHERTRLRRCTDLVIGKVLAVGIPVLAILAFLRSPRFAEAVATAAVALVGVGATLISHGRGARTPA